MTKYALKMSEICIYMHLSLKYAKYAISNWAHFTGKFLIRKHFDDIPYHLSYRKTCHFIKIRSLVMTFTIYFDSKICRRLESCWLTDWNFWLKTHKERYITNDFWTSCYKDDKIFPWKGKVPKFFRNVLSISYF